MSVMSDVSQEFCLTTQGRKRETITMLGSHQPRPGWWETKDGPTSLTSFSSSASLLHDLLDKWNTRRWTSFEKSGKEPLLCFSISIVWSSNVNYLVCPLLASEGGREIDILENCIGPSSATGAFLRLSNFQLFCLSTLVSTPGGIY